MSTAVSASGESGTLRCARHPNTETVLRCGRCDTPICARCMVMSPVGARCPSCAQVRRFSLMLKGPELGRAIAYGVGVGALGTILLTFIAFLGLNLIGYAALGFGVGEAVSVGANRKRVQALAPIAVACLFVGYDLGIAVRLVMSGQPFGPGLLLAPILLLSGGLNVVGLLIGALLAWMRTR
ncbi:MAG TPA: B-box zinc finger protein [Chloroflexota bacterium]